MMNNVEKIDKVSKFENMREIITEKIHEAFGKAVGYHCRILREALQA